MTAAIGAASAPSALPSAARAPGRGFLRAARFLVQAVQAVMLVAAAVAFLLLAVGPRFLGYQTSTMLTGSMAPLINPGDVVVSVKTPTSELKPGDIITYRIPVDDQRVETHRIVSVAHSPTGGTVITTKGDANNSADPWTAVISDDTVFTTAAVVPHLGDVIRVLRSPVVRPVLLFGAPSILVIMLLVSIWRRPASAPSPRDSEARGR